MLLNQLKQHNQNVIIYTDKTCTDSVGPLDSYRGYYEDIAISPSAILGTVGDLMDRIEKSIDKEFYGYKGGTYILDEQTFCWVSKYGDCSGEAITGLEVNEDGRLFIATESDYEEA